MRVQRERERETERSLFFYWRYVAKMRNKTLKNSKKNWFERFSFAINKFKKLKNRHIYICDSSHCVARHIEGWLKIMQIYLHIIFCVYSQIWLNLLMDDCHFSYKRKFGNKTLSRRAVHFGGLEPHLWYHSTLGDFNTCLSNN